MSGRESINRPGKRALIGFLRFLFLVIFLYSVFGLLRYYLEDRRQERSQEEAVERYIEETAAPEIPAGAEKPEGAAEVSVENRTKERSLETGAEDLMTAESAADKREESCPIKVDFDALLAENEDVVGWLYCEDTNIHYPVVQGKDNDYYLHHGYDRKESRAGAIFVDAENRPGFADSNTILYGHHMKNGSMFAHLADFADQEFFDAHPVMWLLTPEQTFKVELLGGYLTSADSDSYTIFTGACEEFDEYLEGAAADSDVQAETETPCDGRYIMLSTCEYDFADARYVLHGRLVPAEGGE